MLADFVEDAAVEVLANYPLPASVRRMSLGNAGGFSGAALWRVDDPPQAYCLKAWPSDQISAQRLAKVHTWMAAARSSGLAFVPTVLRGKNGQAVFECLDRCWDLTQWLPGVANRARWASAAQVEAACASLAQLHAVWSRLEVREAVPPGILRRWRAAEEWLALVRAGWRPNLANPELDPCVEIGAAAWRVLPHFLPEVLRSLAPRLTVAAALFPCLCDVWNEHILYSDGQVTGIVDFGAMRVDHPATDLARLLGSMAGDNLEIVSAGVAAYRHEFPFSAADEELMHVLDRTGTILAAATWLLRLYRDGQQFTDRAAVARRFGAIVDRLRGWAT